MVHFANRTAAGELLATKLAVYRDRPDVLVLALPRGGVPVGFAVARTLQVPLDIFLVRKLGVPGHEELAMGAIASGGTRVLNEEVIQYLGIANAIMEAVAGRELREIARRERPCRENRPARHARGRTVILVGDGLATGSTMRAAIAALRRQEPARIIVAVPIAAPDTCEGLPAEADGVVCAATPEPFYAAGLWYEDFAQTTDEEVRTLLTRAASLPQGKPTPGSERGPTEHLGEQRG